MAGDNCDCITGQSIGVVAFTTLIVGLFILVSSKILADAFDRRRELNKYRETYGEIQDKRYG